MAEVDQAGRAFVEVEGEKVYLEGDYKVGPMELSEVFEMVGTSFRKFLQTRQLEIDDFMVKIKTGDAGALFLLLLTAFLMVLVASSLFEALVPPPKIVIKEEEKTPIVLRDFTIEQLREFDGTNDKPIYIGLKGDVYDVSGAPDHYGPGNPYHLFAGRDTTRSMAKLSFEEADLTNPDVSQLNPFEKDALEDWVHKFKYYKQYPIVGRLTYPKTGLEFSPSQLATFTGTGDIPEGRVNAPVLICLCGDVFDVSYGGFDMYGPEGPYDKFAGKTVSRAFAKMSFDVADVQSSDLSDLDENQLKTLRDWEKKFRESKKYPVVGKLVPEAAGVTVEATVASSENLSSSASE